LLMLKEKYFRVGSVGLTIFAGPSSTGGADEHPGEGARVHMGLGGSSV
jgi:hypothetical protein